MLIRNQDQRSRDYSNIKEKYRPGHADYTFDAKYGFRDYRGGGRSSARETNVRVAAGVVAKKILAHSFGGRVVGYVVQVGDIRAEIENPEAITLNDVEQLSNGEPNIIRCPDESAAARMVELIEQVRKDGDSIGGIAEIVATNIPAGLGEPVFDKVKADLAKALFSLPAVLGVEYGVGLVAQRSKAAKTTMSSPRTKTASRPQPPPRWDVGRNHQRATHRDAGRRQADEQFAQTAKHGHPVGGIHHN